MKEELTDKKLADLKSISGSNTKRIQIPVPIELQEARDLFEWCNKDKELLIKACLEWNMVEDMPVRIEALSKAQSKCNNEFLRYRSSLQGYKAEAREAFDLHKEITHCLNYAIKKYPEAFSNFEKVKVNTVLKLIKNLDNMVVIGNQKKTELASIGFDPDLLVKAKTQHLKLKELQRKIKKNLKEYGTAIKLRNKAYFHLKHAVDEIRRAGKYVFWEDEDRRTGYVSLYLRTKREKSKKKKISNNSEI